jgi:hypothetical protein
MPDGDETSRALGDEYEMIFSVPVIKMERMISGIKKREERMEHFR